MATSAFANAFAFAASAPVFAAFAPVFAASAPVFAVCACVLNVSVSVFIFCNSDLYVVDTWWPKFETDKLVSDNLTSIPFADETKLKPKITLNLLLASNVKLLESYLNSNHLVAEWIDKPFLIPLNSNTGDNWLLTLTFKYSAFKLYSSNSVQVTGSIDNCD